MTKTRSSLQFSVHMSIQSDILREQGGPLYADREETLNHHAKQSVKDLLWAGKSAGAYITAIDTSKSDELLREVARTVVERNGYAGDEAGLEEAADEYLATLQEHARKAGRLYTAQPFLRNDDRSKNQFHEMDDDESPVQSKET